MAAPGPLRVAPPDPLRQRWGLPDTARPTPDFLLPEPLPIEAFREQILAHIRAYRVTFVQGETGCGKSSMVPQFLFHDDPANRVLVTQPRRLAAVALARRVAQQMGPGGADAVGYRLELGEVQETAQTRVTFCTATYLLRFLAEEPASLKPFTHLVLDEVHERTMDSDLLLLLTKILMRLHPHIRLVIMSATLQPQLFADYFVQFHPGLRPLQVGRQRFPVQTLFLEDLQEVYPDLAIVPAYFETISGESYSKPTLTKSMQVTLVELIKLVAQPGLAILVFLPGASEIDAVQSALRREAGDVPFQVVPLHTFTPNEEQAVALEPPQPGRCKVVLSTNVAESSITIPDVHFVIDSGLRKGVFVDPETGRPALVYRWVSRASAQQRAGRTGRVSPGTAVRLYTSALHRIHFTEFDEPELDHGLLERMVLNARLLLAKYGSLTQLLEMTMAPPPAFRVSQALDELMRCGALTAPTPDAQVTTIGKLAVQLPLDLPHVRLLLFGHVFGCLVETVVLATVLSQPDLFATPTRAYAGSARNLAKQLCTNFSDRARMDRGTYSEALAGMFGYAAWLDHRRCSVSAARAKAADLLVADLCRALLLSDVLPLSRASRQDLEALLQLTQEGGPALSAHGLLTRRPVELLHFVLAVAAAPNFLVAKPPTLQSVEELAHEHGLDVPHTVLLKGVTTLTEKGSALRHALTYPGARPTRVIMYPSTVMQDRAKDVLVQFSPEAKQDDKPSPGDLKDISYAPKLIHHLLLHGRFRLPILAEGLGEDVATCGAAFPYQVAWSVLGARGTTTADVVAKVNPRGVLACLGDVEAGAEKWQPYIASAFALLPTDSPAVVVANGVTVMPTKYFGNLIVLLTSPIVKRVFLRLAPDSPEEEPEEEKRKHVRYDRHASLPEPEFKKSRRFVISAAVVQVRDLSVRLSFEPHFLNAKQWSLINVMRSLISRAVQGGLTQDAALQKDAYLFLESLRLPDFRVPLRDRRGLTPSFWQTTAAGPSRRGGRPTPGEDGSYWDPPEGERRGGLTFEERAPPQVWRNGWRLDVMDFDQEGEPLTWSEHAVDTVGTGQYLPELQVGKEVVAEEVRLRREEENRVRGQKRHEKYMNYFRRVVRKALTASAMLWQPSGNLPADYPTERMPRMNLSSIKALTSISARQWRRSMGLRTLRDLLECEALADLVVVRPAVGDVGGFLVERAPTFEPVKTYDRVPKPLVPPPVPHVIRNEPRRMEYVMFRELVASVIKLYPEGIPLGTFVNRHDGFLEYYTVRRRRAIGYKTVLHLLFSMPDLIRVEGTLRVGYRLYPASTPPTPEADLLHVEGTPDTGFVVWELDQEGFNCGLYPRPGEFELAQRLGLVSSETGAEEATSSTSAGNAFVATPPPPPGTPAEAQAEEAALAAAMESPEALAKVTAQLWSTEECRTYARLRATVQAEIALWPGGVRAMQLVLSSELASKVPKVRRDALGYQSVWEVLRSMPDVVRIEEERPDPQFWTLYPASPSPSAPSDATEPEGTTTGEAPLPAERLQWATYEHVYFLAGDQSIVDFPVPNFAVCKRRKGLVGSGEVRREFVWFRDLVKRFLPHMKGPMELREFGEQSGLTSRKARRQRRGLRCSKLLTFVCSMPDLITVQTDPEDPEGYLVYPRPAVGHSRLVLPQQWQLTDPWPGDRLEAELGGLPGPRPWGLAWEEGDGSLTPEADRRPEAAQVRTITEALPNTAPPGTDSPGSAGAAAGEAEPGTWGDDWAGQGYDAGAEQRSAVAELPWLEAAAREEDEEEAEQRAKALVPPEPPVYDLLPPPGTYLYLVTLAPPPLGPAAQYCRPDPSAAPAPPTAAPPPPGLPCSSTAAERPCRCLCHRAAPPRRARPTPPLSQGARTACTVS